VDSTSQDIINHELGHCPLVNGCLRVPHVGIGVPDGLVSEEIPMVLPAFLSGSNWCGRCDVLRGLGVRRRGVLTIKSVLDNSVFLINFIFMFTVGMELEPQHFRDVTQRIRPLIMLFAGQIIMLPLLGLLLVRTMILPPAISAGILLLAACPVGDIANFYTLLARGNVALSVMMNALTCMLSIFTMAMVFEVYAFMQGKFEFAVPPLLLVVRLTLMVLIPMLAGMFIRWAQPAWAVCQARIFRNISIVGVIFLIIYVMVTQQQLLAMNWRSTAIAGLVFMVLALLTGFAYGLVLRMPTADIMTSGIVFSVRNVGLAMVIAVTLLNRIDYAVFAVVYFLAEVPLLLGVVMLSPTRKLQPLTQD
jgi:BASS family bile acid:Na+ symporter